MPRTTTQRKRLPAAQRRQLLLDAAARAFAERGYQGAAMDVIARDAGVTVPVLYDHFPSKAQLYGELVEVHYASLREIWFRHAASGRPVQDWLGPAIAEWFGYVKAHPFAGRMLFHEATRDQDAYVAHRAIQERSREDVT